MSSSATVTERSLQELRPVVDAALQDRLQPGPLCPARLQEAMAYSLMSGGKRLRAILVLLSAEACGGNRNPALPAACAIEMMHAYSLIHDDLPAMDDDDLRRGQPTVHIVFGEALAILAGDALLTRAFEVLAGEITPPETAARCCALLASAGGAIGMVGGQVADLEATSAPEHTSGPAADRDLETLRHIHQRKTGRLFACSFELGAAVAGADDLRQTQLRDAGLALGQAFQITDDLLDVDGNIERTGKAGGRDHDLGKLTYPALVGVEESWKQARQHVALACEVLAPLGERADRLRALAEFIIERDH